MILYVPTRLHTTCIRHAKRFPPISVRYMSDSPTFHAHLPSGEEYPVKPVKYAWTGSRIARRVLRKSLESRMSYNKCFTLIPPTDGEFNISNPSHRSSESFYFRIERFSRSIG
ncbi:MAG: hypothetical protein EZS26_003089 [Candidatus Ordinivivax streblomastigis]|uniref:Uncharacterized protein n=1 Tax=Candidatus Ordinivivax streblomastigis TaxID=2540710 RepID=A0A5M8NWM4_9BACT|nr:MAG: hypothetical protein EZS26_003089 [Candidatus Ordinivivax streblomastigis]